jgi:hypothetical protein
MTKAAVKKAKQFFQQNLAKRLYEAYPPHQIDFEVEVVSQPPRPPKGDTLIEVWIGDYPDNAGPTLLGTACKGFACRC